MYNPITIFVLGAACGALTVLFALLAWWMHSRDAAQSGYQQYHSHYAFGRGMAVAGFGCVGCAAIAVVGAIDPIFGLPHLEWPAGVLIGAGVPLGLVYTRRRAPTGRKLKRSLSRFRG